MWHSLRVENVANAVGIHGAINAPIARRVRPERCKRCCEMFGPQRALPAGLGSASRLHGLAAPMEVSAIAGRRSVRTSLERAVAFTRQRR